MRDLTSRERIIIDNLRLVTTTTIFRELLNDWERKFITSISESVENGWTLSTAQFNKLQSIASKHR